MDETMVHLIRVPKPKQPPSKMESSFSFFKPFSKPKPKVNWSSEDILIDTVFGAFKVIIRPGLDVFLEEMSKMYDLVLYTANIEDVADKVLGHIDPNQKYFKHRFYRDSCGN